MIDLFFSILLLFFIPSNILLLLVLRYAGERNKYLLFIFSYGVGPFLSALIFYYLIWFFSGRSEFFYLGVILISWIILMFFSIKTWKYLINLYKKIGRDVWQTVKQKRNIIFIPVLFFLAIFSTQALFYPVVGNDSAAYLNQSEAYYQYRNLDWRKENNIIIREDDEIKYNSAIRPAIPSFMAFSFVFDANRHDYFLLKFLTTYYYYLLLIIFLVTVYRLAIALKKDVFYSVLFGSFFFIFSWTLTRSFIFNAKESIIYFFALLSIWIVYDLIKLRKRDLKLEIMLGIIIGLNTFVNLHGILIGLFLMTLLFFFSTLKLKERVIQGLYIFSLHLFFGSFEFLKTFNFIFAKNIEFLKRYLLEVWHHSVAIISSVSDSFKAILSSSSSSSSNGGFSNNEVNINNPIFSKSASVTDSSLDKKHLEIYQFSNKANLYLRGKLQILTNIGVFGFYFWFFLLTLFFKIKEIFSTRLGKILLSFIFIYILIVLDPFNLNHHKYAVILAGSSKYAALVLLVSLIVTSVYAKYFIEKILYFCSIYVNLILGIFFSFLLVLINTKDELILLGTKILLSVIPIFKNNSYYEDKVELFYYIVLVNLLLVILVFILLKFKKELMGKILFVSVFILLFIITPFFITEVGKISYVKTISHVNKSLQKKLENTVNFGDIYRVYFYAKNNLPKGTRLKSSFKEVYTYDNYFNLTKNGEAMYFISKKCEKKILFRSGSITLCKVK